MKSIDDINDKIYEAKPITKYSFYLNGRIEILLETKNEIVSSLEALNDTGNSSENISNAEKLLWFWILGAYEVVRTMHQSKASFSEKVLKKLQDLKQVLAKARMPASKMEVKNKKQAVTSFRSPIGIDVKAKDFELFTDDENFISAKSLLSSFEEVIKSITTKDILAPHQSNY